MDDARKGPLGVPGYRAADIKITSASVVVATGHDEVPYLHVEAIDPRVCPIPENRRNHATFGGICLCGWSQSAPTRSGRARLPVVWIPVPGMDARDIRSLQRALQNDWDMYGTAHLINTAEREAVLLNPVRIWYAPDHGEPKPEPTPSPKEGK